MPNFFFTSSLTSTREWVSREEIFNFIYIVVYVKKIYEGKTKFPKKNTRDGVIGGGK